MSSSNVGLTSVSILVLSGATGRRALPVLHVMIQNSDVCYMSRIYR